MNTIDNMQFRRATAEEMPRIIALQADVFSGEQGIPRGDVDTFVEKNPICWCAESEGKIYGAVAAWHQDGEMHWGRFVVFPAARGHHIGTRLARCSFDDIFSDGTEKLIIDARDATVKIVCSMGGKIAGEAYKFYDGNVTPVILRKQDYIRE